MPSRLPTRGDGEAWTAIFAVLFTLAGIYWGVLWFWDHIILASVLPDHCLPWSVGAVSRLWHVRSYDATERNT
jgi:hypothetical protein